jgi:hypothetical protein
LGNDLITGGGGDFPVTYKLTILGINNMIVEGGLYRESSAPEVYVIYDGKKVHIPTPHALFGMGYDWSVVKVVSDGALNSFPRFDIPSASPTPGSLIFPPDFPSGNFLTFDKSHYALKISNSTKVMSLSSWKGNWWQEIQVAEIRGWLMDDIIPLPPDGKANPEPPDGKPNAEGIQGWDWGFNLLPDYRWLKEQNIDVNKVIKVGNIVGLSDLVLGTTAKSLVSIPYVDVEVNSWLYRNRA